MGRHSETIFAGVLCLVAAAMFHADLKALAICIVSLCFIGTASRYDDVCHLRDTERKARKSPALPQQGSAS